MHKNNDDNDSLFLNRNSGNQEREKGMTSWKFWVSEFVNLEFYIQQKYSLK